MLSLLALVTLRCSGDNNVQPPSASAIAMVDGNAQTGPVGSALSAPLVVKVTDDNGDPVAGVAVAWTANDGAAVSAPSVTTGADGRASVQVTLGSTAGEQTTVAT
ncbi:MAG TPA: Ig-like domain-containing protein, partial [Gemmatimonadales bacterium]|nr:Ig-like domain-containing protein [Gemmatimonadales bacterium]